MFSLETCAAAVATQGQTFVAMVMLFVCSCYLNVESQRLRLKTDEHTKYFRSLLFQCSADWDREWNTHVVSANASEEGIGSGIVVRLGFDVARTLATSDRRQDWVRKSCEQCETPRFSVVRRNGGRGREMANLEVYLRPHQWCTTEAAAE